MTSDLESTNLSSTKSYLQQDLKKVSSLRLRLLTTILPTVLIPLVIASGIGYIIAERNAKQEVLEELESKALASSNTIVAFIQKSFDSIDFVAANPDVIEAMKDGNEKSQTQKLEQQSINEIEKQFAATKLLIAKDRLNQYLQQIVRSGQAAEIFLTEGHGFNVAFSNPTSDFVQNDEGWWQTSQQRGKSMAEPEFDESANTNIIPFSKAVRDTQTGEFLGVIKMAIPINTLVENISTYVKKTDLQSSQLQIVDPDDSFVLYSSDLNTQMNSPIKDDDETEASASLDDDDDEETKTSNVIGSETIVEVIKIIVRVEGNSLGLEVGQEEEEEKEGEEETESSLSLQDAQTLIAQQPGVSEINLRQTNIVNETSTVASFKHNNKIYTLTTIPQTDFVSIGLVDYQEVVAEARQLLTVFALTTIILGLLSSGLILFLAQQITKPLTNLSATTQKVAAGDLDIQANIEGTLETRTLADNFNNLVKQIKKSLQTQQTLADEQRQGKEQLEKAIYTLIEEISSATEGDLTVRANLDSMELSTVADLFNAIIDNLQEIAIEAKQSTSQVGDSLKQNEDAIRLLAEQAIAEAEETRNTLVSVEQMSQSIQTVARNADRAEQIVDDNYNTVLTSTKNMDLTVNSILNLRTTVGETAKKMKRLGESSQKISQAVSFIQEIALKTNILAINATVEAGRAGEYGEGFTIVAEQVAALAEQSAAATKEIAGIVAVIQAETQDVNQAMESGTTQVVETTRLVETTKENLGLVLEKSQEINLLMESISESTLSQTTTSQNVTNLMQKIARLSESTSKSSQKVAQSIMETAQVAAKLESTVSQFKVAD